MERHQIRIILGMAESAADVIIDEVDFKVRVGYPQVVDPNAEFEKGFWKMNGRLVVGVDPIVDGHAGRRDTKSTVENRAWLFVDFGQVHHADRCSMEMGGQLG